MEDKNFDAVETEGFVGAVDAVEHDVRRVEFDMDMISKDYVSLVMNSVMGKNRFAMFGAVGIIVIGLGYLILGYAGVIEMSGILKLVAVALIVVDILLFILMNYIRRKLWSSDVSYMGTKRHVIVCEEAVFSETDDEDTTRRFEWEDLYNGQENSKYFLAYSKTGMIVFWPKRFLTAEQIPQVRKIMKVMMQSLFKTNYKIN